MMGSCLYWLCIVDSTSLFLSRRGVVIFSFCQSGVDVEKLWTVFGDIQKNINNAYKNISSALCPHSLLVVSIMTRAARNSWPCHWQYQGHGLLMQLIRYRTVAKFFFFFYRRVRSNEATDQTRTEVQASRGEIGLSSWDCITRVL